MKSNVRSRRSRTSLLASLSLLSAGSFACATGAFAQAVSGTIVGTVTDSSGAFVANAQVIMTLTGQGTVHTAITNANGNYTEPDLPPGVYTVTIIAPGFKKDTRQNIQLETNTTARVDVGLANGSQSEEITVTDAPPQLQTDRADISTVISSRQIADLPLSSGNSFQSLLNTVPGMAPVVFNNSQFFNANNDLSVNANGQSSYVNLYQIEGIDDDQRTGIHIILVPPAAAIANVDITTNNFDAEFGRAVGTVVNVTLKSGTNSIHGSAFQNMENNGVNGRNYFAQGPNGRLVYNYTGGSIGFPILKDKLFVFGDFLRSSDHESSTILTNIPYYNVVNGNVDLGGAAYLVKSGSNTVLPQVYDPNTGTTASCSTNVASTPVCGTGRTPFANNQIPLTNAGISPVGLKTLQLLDAQARNPAINLASATYLAGSTTSNNFSRNLPFSKDAISYDIKADYQLSKKDHLSGRFSHQTTNTFQAPLFGSFLGGPVNGGFEATGIAATYSTGVNYTHLFSNTLILEARAGVAHSRNTAQQSDYGSNDANALGIPGNGPNGTDNVVTSSGQVAFQVSNFAGNGTNGTANPLIGYSQSLPWVRAESNIDFSAIVTKILGNHTLKLGADVRRIRDDLLQGNNNAAAGSFYFSENQTSAPGANATGQANDVASVLFGVPYQVGQDTNSTFPTYRQTWEFFFVADKWQATSKLTLDLGLRYELYPPPTPRKAGGFVSYDPGTNTLTQAGIAGNPSNIGEKTDYVNFAPRLGASYRVTEKTVVRAGFGVSYVPFVDNSYAYNYPIKTSTFYTNSPTYGSALNPAGGVVNFATGIPATPTVAFSSTGTLTESAANGTLGLANLYIPLNFKNAYVTSWNAVVEQVMPFDSTLQIAYVANHGTRIDTAQNINLPTVYGQGAAYDPLNHQSDGVTTTFGKTASVTQYFQGYSTNYQSLQVEFKHRFNHGLAFGSTFTWGKAENYQTGAQDGNLLFYAGPVHRNYSVADFDRTRNFSQTITYELPAGHGHRYFASGPAVYALGGWKVSAIVSAVSGQPFTVTGTSITPGTTQTGNLNGTYSVTHGVTGTISSGSPTWFNPAPFAQVPGTCSYTPASPFACPLGNTGRNQFRGPGYFSDNVSMFKSLPLYKERVNLELRLDAFNLTNTPAFGLPGTTVGSANFGKITSTLGSGVGNVNGVGGPRVLQAAAKFTF